MFQKLNSLSKEQIILVVIHILALGFGIAAVGLIVIPYFALGFALALALHSLDQEG